MSQGGMAGASAQSDIGLLPRAAGALWNETLFLARCCVAESSPVS